MQPAQKIYDDLWSQTLPLFLKDQYETDPLITDPNDLRRGLTLRAGLSEEVIVKIEDFTERLRSIIPGQYFIPASDLHLTILAIVGCHADFHHDAALDQSYIETISKCIRDLPRPRIKFSGITASSSCLLLQGYPENSSLAELRNRLRETFKASTLPNSMDSRYSIKTAHVTIMRFQKPQSSLSDFIQFITENKNRDFGSQGIDRLELVSNDWYHKKNNTKRINIFSLNGYAESGA
jgi:2'-5' RNA ligase